MAETQDPPLNELLTRSMVDIYVGPESTHWILHEKLLTHRSKFFRNIFSSKDSSSSSDEPSSSSDDQSFELPDEEPAAFKLFVGWLYAGAVPVPREEKDLGPLFELYLMGEKWQIRGLIHDSLEAVRNFYHEHDAYPALRRVQYLYANTELESPMRTLLVGSVARFFVVKSEGMPPQWDKALRKNGQLAVDIIIAMQKWNLDADSVPDPRDASVKPIMEEAEEKKESKGEDGEGLTNGVEGENDNEEEEHEDGEENDDDDDVKEEES